MPIIALLRALTLGTVVLAWLAVLLGCGFLRPPGPGERGPLELRAVAGAGPVTVHDARSVETGARLSWTPFGPPGRWARHGQGWVCRVPGPDGGLRLQPPADTPVQVVLARGPEQGRCVITLGSSRWARDLALGHVSATSVLVDPRPSWLASPAAWATAVLVALGIGGLALQGLPGPVWAGLAGVSGLGVLALVADAGYPGNYSVDALLQLKQVLSRTYVDHHPPILAGLWTALMATTGWLPSLWLLHLALLGGGLAAWGAAAWQAGIRAGLLGLPWLLASPVALSCLMAMWKDTGFAAAMVTASGLVALAYVRRHLGAGLGLALVVVSFYAANVRHNGLPALLPLFWVAAGLLPGRLGGNPAWRATATLGLLAALLAGGKALDAEVLHARRTHLQQVVQLHDLAAIAVMAGKNHLPAYVREHPNYDEERLRDEYWRSRHVYAGANFLMIEGYPPPLAMTADPAQVSQLRGAWLAAIADAPGTYLQHRWAFFRMLMKPPGEPYFVPPPPRPFRELELRWALTADELKVAQARTPEPPPATSARLAALRWAETWQDSRLYLGWLYLALAVACLGVAVAARRRHPFIPLGGMVAASALLYLGLYLFVMVWCEYRYLYWGGVASLLAAWALAVGLTSPPRQAPE